VTPPDEAVAIAHRRITTLQKTGTMRSSSRQVFAIDASAAPREFPGATLMILGAARCGTSSLHELLRRHPEVCASEPKEPFFFEDRSEYEQGIEHYRRSYFPHWHGQRVVVEGRAANMVLPYVAPRIKATFPEARFVVALRDPVRRAYSHWALKHALALESRDFEAAIAQTRRRLETGNPLDGPDGERLWRAAIRRHPPHVGYDVYVEAGQYAHHLKRFFAIFPRERFFIVCLEEIERHPADVARRLFQFAGLDPAPAPVRLPHRNASSQVGSRFLHRIDHALHLHSALPLSWRRWVRRWTSVWQRRPPPEPEALLWLRAHFAPHDEELCRLLGWTQCPWQTRREAGETPTPGGTPA
jgi:hypothetical protein